MAQVANVTFSQANNVWLLYEFQFGVVGDTSWSFVGKSFICDFKAEPDQLIPDLATSSDSNTLIVLDAVNRILKFNVTDHQLRNALDIGPYFFDVVMIDNSTGERDPLMTGVMTITQGISIED